MSDKTKTTWNDLRNAVVELNNCTKSQDVSFENIMRIKGAVLRCMRSFGALLEHQTTILREIKADFEG